MPPRPQAESFFGGNNNDGELARGRRNSFGRSAPVPIRQSRFEGRYYRPDPWYRLTSPPRVEELYLPIARPWALSPDDREPARSRRYDVASGSTLEGGRYSSRSGFGGRWGPSTERRAERVSGELLPPDADKSVRRPPSPSQYRRHSVQPVNQKPPTRSDTVSFPPHPASPLALPTLPNPLSVSSQSSRWRQPDPQLQSTLPTSVTTRGESEVRQKNNPPSTESSASRPPASGPKTRPSRPVLPINHDLPPSPVASFQTLSSTPLEPRPSSDLTRKISPATQSMRQRDPVDKDQERVDKKPVIHQLSDSPSPPSDPSPSDTSRVVTIPRDQVGEECWSIDRIQFIRSRKELEKTLSKGLRDQGYHAVRFLWAEDGLGIDCVRLVAAVPNPVGSTTVASTSETTAPRDCARGQSKPTPSSQTIKLDLPAPHNSIQPDQKTRHDSTPPTRPSYLRAPVVVETSTSSRSKRSTPTPPKPSVKLPPSKRSSAPSDVPSSQAHGQTKPSIDPRNASNAMDIDRPQDGEALQQLDVDLTPDQETMILRVDDGSDAEEVGMPGIRITRSKSGSKPIASTNRSSTETQTKINTTAKTKVPPPKRTRSSTAHLDEDNEIRRSKRVADLKASKKQRKRYKPKAVAFFDFPKHLEHLTTKAQRDGNADCERFVQRAVEKAERSLRIAVFYHWRTSGLYIYPKKNQNLEVLSAGADKASTTLTTETGAESTDSDLTDESRESSIFEDSEPGPLVHAATITHLERPVSETPTIEMNGSQSYLPISADSTLSSIQEQASPSEPDTSTSSITVPVVSTGERNNPASVTASDADISIRQKISKKLEESEKWEKMGKDIPEMKAHFDERVEQLRAEIFDLYDQMKPK